MTYMDLNAMNIQESRLSGTTAALMTAIAVWITYSLHFCLGCALHHPIKAS